MVQKMKHRNGIIILFIIMATFGCRPDPQEYARPDNLVGTIYPQLEALGTFDYYLRCIDQTEYGEPLTKGGSWTIFAPNDTAFEAFMQQEGYASFEAIPAQRILEIVQYSIIIDGWNTTTLTYYPGQFYEGTSFRRTTQYVDPVVPITVTSESHAHFIEEVEPGEYLLDTSMGRGKTTSYFLDSYFDYNEFERSDYDFMFPGETFTEGDMKVFEANVERQNIIAENGIIYELDKVIEPRKNLYQNLSDEKYEGKYSTFKRILERFATLYYAGEKINEETGQPEDIYQYRFETGIANNNPPYSPNDEAFPALLNNSNRTLANATGLLVPTNEALENFIQGNSILGKFYNSYDDMPLDVLGKFISPNFFIMFWNICPSDFGQAYDVGQNLSSYKADDVVDTKLCSNGLFVGVNTVYVNNSFSTIMGPLLLNPEYSIMLKAVQDAGIDNALLSTGVRFSIFGIKNEQFKIASDNTDDWIADPNSATRKVRLVDYNEDLSEIYMEVKGDPSAANNRIYPDPDASKPNSSDVEYVATTLKDIVLNQIVEQEVDFGSNNYYKTKSDEYVYISNGNTVAGGGDIYRNRNAQVLEVEPTDNGNFYGMTSFVERPLRFTYRALKDNSAVFSRFLEVLDAADAIIDIPDYSDDKLVSFLNLQKTFTLLAPNNDAVNQAIADGVIVDPNDLKSLDPLELALAKRALLNFAKKHFMQQSVPTDGKTTGTITSTYFGKEIDFVPVYEEFQVENNHSNSSLTLTNTETGEAVTTGGIVNLLSKRVVIHEINNYIK